MTMVITVRVADDDLPIMESEITFPKSFLDESTTEQIMKALSERLSMDWDEWVTKGYRFEKPPTG